MTASGARLGIAFAAVAAPQSKTRIFSHTFKASLQDVVTLPNALGTKAARTTNEDVRLILEYRLSSMSVSGFIDSRRPQVGKNET